MAADLRQAAAADLRQAAAANSPAVAAAARQVSRASAHTASSTLPPASAHARRRLCLATRAPDGLQTGPARALRVPALERSLPAWRVCHVPAQHWCVGPHSCPCQPMRRCHQRHRWSEGVRSGLPAGSETRQQRAQTTDCWAASRAAVSHRSASAACTALLAFSTYATCRSRASPGLRSPNLSPASVKESIDRQMSRSMLELVASFETSPKGPSEADHARAKA